MIKYLLDMRVPGANNSNVIRHIPYGSVVLANIIYTMEHKTVDKDIYLDNSGSDGDASDALGYVASGLELSGTAYIDTQLDYTLGSELMTVSPTIAYGSETSTITTPTTDSLNVAVTVTGTSYNKPSISYDLGLEEGSSYKLSFDFLENIDLLQQMTIYLGGVIVEQNAWKPTDGSYEYIITDDGTWGTGLFTIYMDGRQLSDFSMTNMSVKKITFNTESLWVYDYSTNTFDIRENFTDTKERIELGVYGHYFELHATHNANDVTLLNANPELVLRMLKGDTETGLSFNASNVVDYMQPTREYEDLVPDLTTELLYPVKDFASIVNAFGGAVYAHSYTPYVLDLAVTAVGTATYYPRAKYTIDAIDEEYSVLRFDAIINSGTAIINRVMWNNSTDYVNLGEIQDGVNEFIILTKNKTATNFYLAMDGTKLFDISISNLSVEGLVSDEIINHVGDTAYTNADQQTKGVPMTMFKRDSLGRVTDLADENTIEFNGDNIFFDPDWTPNSDVDWSLSIMLYFKTESTIQRIGTSSNNGLYFNMHTNGRLYPYALGKALQWLNMPTGWFLAHVTYDATLKEINFYKNAVITPTIADITATNTEVFKIGHTGLAGYEPLNPVGITRIHKEKVLSQTEIDAELLEMDALYLIP